MGARELDEWRILASKAQDYYKEHEKEIQSQLSGDREREILVALPTTVKRGFMVWCRNGEVCREATPCNQLVCGYKSDKADVVSGCARCQRFQVTTVGSKGWYNSEHVDIYGNPEGGR